MDPLALEQLRRLEGHHWWFRGRRRVYLGVLRAFLERERSHRPGQPAIEHALDLGTGGGGFLPGLAGFARRVHALDREPVNLTHAAARGLGGGVLAEAVELPLATGSLGLLCAFDVLEHLDDEDAALAEWHRVLEPGGILLLSVPAYPSLYSTNDRLSHHRRRYRRGPLEAALVRAGFLPRRVTHTNVLLLPPIALALGLGKAWERVRTGLLGREPARRTNLSVPMPRPLNALLGACFAAERPWVERFDAPFGHSILALAERPRQPG